MFYEGIIVKAIASIVILMMILNKKGAVNPPN